MSELNSLTDSFEKILAARRSIRLFDQSEIPEKVVRKAIDLALLSPSSSNLQPWQFYRFRKTTPDLCLCFLNQTAAVTASELIVAVARPDRWKDSNRKIISRLMASGATKPPHYTYLMNYHERTVPFSQETGFLGIKGMIRSFFIFLLGIFRPVVREGFFFSSLTERAVKGTALACQTLMLALAAQGYDSCPMEGFDSKRLRKLLKLPRGATIVMGIAVGQRHLSYTPPNRMRFDYDEVVVGS